MSTLIVIPARLESSRLPGKILKEKNGVTLIEHMYQLANSTGFDTVIALDHPKTQEHVEGFNGNYIMTKPELSSGTDRVCQILNSFNYDTYINLQADMPYISAEQIRQVLKPLSKGYDLGTLIYEMESTEQANPNSVKCIASEVQELYNCHWFLRAAVSYGFHHAGIYAFAKETLNQYNQLKQTQAEKIESLEQLRWLASGFKIGACLTSKIEGEINT